MYKEEELLEKVKGHIKDGQIDLLKSLIHDVDELNEKQVHLSGDMYIDFDNVGNDSEFDPYETFSLRIKAVNEEVKYTPVIASEMSLSELDYSLACLCGYFDEYDELENPDFEGFKKYNEEIVENVLKEIKDGNIVFKTGDGRTVKSKLSNFTEQTIDSQLYDINRLPDVILSLKDNDISKYQQHWINDMALVNLVKYYYNRCIELEAKLVMLEDKLLLNSIIN